MELNELGIAKKKAEKLTGIAFIVCPLCCRHRPLGRTGIYRVLRRIRKKTRSRADIYNPERKLTFDSFDIDKSPFISLRVNLGRAKGFKEVAIIPLSDVGKLSGADKKIIMPLIRQLNKQCKNIIKVTSELL